ncbi:hypothetical protein ONS96_014788 [Cadophora gregata f. sp. sojae]|nr:hypothetical protein ONS96_014788 [Cadophora gregata f. sp. sojae]
MSRLSRTNNSHGLAYDLNDRSIGIIPDLFRSTYRSGVKICSAIAECLGTGDVAEPIPKPNKEPRTVKKSVYRQPDDFKPSEMPGTWKQSVESLTAALGALDMGAGGDKDALHDRGDADDMAGNNRGKKAVEVALGSGTAEKCRFAEATAKNWASLCDAANQPASEYLEGSNFEFYPFKRLPPEIRLKILRFAATHQRIIAFELFDDGLDFHSRLVIKGRSQIPPLLHVNREAYGECRKLYLKRKGCFVPPHLYNPSTDIVYFGGRTHCSQAFSAAFWGKEDFQDDDQDNGFIDCFRTCAVPRVAIDLSIPLADCCRGESDESRVSQTMRGLHGYMNQPKGENLNKRSLYCRGLKEVLLVMESRPFTMTHSRINPATSFHPASTIGINEAQAALRKEFEEEIAKIQDEKPSLWGPNAWIGDDKPTFTFVNLARDKAGEAFESLPALRSEVNELKVHHSSFINELRQSTGCKIIIPHQVDDDEAPMEIGIKGTKEGVEVCRRKIQAMIDLHL